MSPDAGRHACRQRRPGADNKVNFTISIAEQKKKLSESSESLDVVGKDSPDIKVAA